MLTLTNTQLISKNIILIYKKHANKNCTYVMVNINGKLQYLTFMVY